MRIVYLHGFASSPQSSKAQFFAAKFCEAGVPFEAPDLDGGDFERLTKKEAAKLTEELNKLNDTLGGIRKMKRLPGAIFIVDPHRERIAEGIARGIIAYRGR